MSKSRGHKRNPLSYAWIGVALLGLVASFLFRPPVPVSTSDPTGPGPREVEVPPGESAIELQAQIGSGIAGRIVDCQGNPGGGFRIRVRERKGNPGGGFRIRVRERKSEHGGYRLRGAGQSEDDGSFEFLGLRPGEKLLRFDRVADGRAEAFSLAVTLEAGRVHDCGTIGPWTVEGGGARLIGAVRHAVTGKTIGGGKIRCRVAREREEVVNLDFESDARGRFEICGLPEGEVFVSATKNLDGQHLFVSERPVLKRSEVREITLLVKPPVLRPGGHLELLLVLPDGSFVDLTSVEGPHCYLRDLAGNWHVELDQDGIRDEEERWLLKVGRPSPGVYEALVTTGNFLGRTGRCEIRDGKTARARVDLIEAVSIRGRLVDAATGRGVRGWAARELKSAESRLVSTDPEDTAENGTFAAFLFAPGETGVLRVGSRGFKTRGLNVAGQEKNVGDVILQREDHSY